MIAALIVLAKAPLPGRVKTRLCPPCTADQAAAVAAAALRDTLAVATTAPVARRHLALSGDLAAPPGWTVTPQRGSGLGERLANAFADTAAAGLPSMVIGMDTPQVTAGHLMAAASLLDDADAVIGPAADGGWWTLALRDPGHGRALIDVPMSTPDTGALTVAALLRRGLTVAVTATLRDVDTAADAWAVARLYPSTGFAAAVRTHVPIREGVA